MSTNNRVNTMKTPNKSHTVASLSDGMKVLRDKAFRVDHPFRATRQIFGPTVLDTEGEIHVSRKRAWLAAFSKANVGAPAVEEVISVSVNEGFEAAEVARDLMLVATYVPSRVVLLLLGCSAVDPLEHAHKTRPLIEYLETNKKSEEVASAKSFLKSILASADGILFSGLPDKEREAELMLLAVAGLETTTVAMKILLHEWALRNQEICTEAQLHGLSEVVNRLMRDDPPLGVATRYCMRDTEVGSVAFKKGDIVHVDIVGVNAECAHAKSTGMPTDLTFGGGLHACPGHLLAKAELTSVAQRLMQMDRASYVVEGEPLSPRAMNFRHPSGIVIAPRLRR